jgi:peptidoglycan/LPS O-acetylase OafA/YrhL
MSESRLERLWRRIRLDLLEPPTENFGALDGMRGFASVIVLTYHCAMFMGFLSDRVIADGRFPTLRAVINGFWSGIDIFFVLSGFLIGRILMLDLFAFDHIRYRKFFIRRSMRIFPAYYLILALSLFAIAPVNPGVFPLLYVSGDWNALLASSWANFVYLNNYVTGPDAPNILSWGWSLCVEEHFYLLLPPLLWAVFRFRSPTVRATLLALAIFLPLLSRAIQYVLDPTIQIMEGFYYYSHNRFDEIFVGVFIAYLYVAHNDALRAAVVRAGALVPSIGLSCVAAVWVGGGLQRQGQFVVVWQFVIMAIGSGLLLLNGLFQDNRVARFFAHRAWYPLARISYGTYLVHPFVLFGVLSLHRGFWGGVSDNVTFVWVTIAVFVLSSIVAAVLFMVLERPLLDIGARWSRRYA